MLTNLIKLKVVFAKKSMFLLKFKWINAGTNIYLWGNNVGKVDSQLLSNKFYVFKKIFQYWEKA